MEWRERYVLLHVIWIALAAPVAIEAAIYVRMHSMVVLGQVLDWLTTAMLACAITFVWIPPEISINSFSDWHICCNIDTS